MADFVSVNIVGAKELERKLVALGPKIGLQALRGALVSGGQIIKKDAIARAPEKTGRLKRAIYIKRLTKPNPFQERVIVGVRSGVQFIKKGLDAFYWKFQEFDHLVRPKHQQRVNRRRSYIATSRAPSERLYAASSGTKKVKARPFIQPAFESRKLLALEKIKVVLANKIKQFAKERA